ncbi:MAG: tetratricopeptide repeat protein [Methanothrix sp.]|jgi:tetratricopeptide (TPR) repeat protein|nr:tetratricopeptide repeat protein [Methanothrix sp.]
MQGGLDMVVAHHRLPLIIIIALVVIFLTLSWITAQGIEDCYGSDCHTSRSEWQQRVWYADIYNFLYGDCQCYYAQHGVYYPPYAGEISDTSANNAPTSSSSTVSENASSLQDEANVFYLTGSYEQAAKSYANAVNIDPTLSKGWLNLGNSLYFLGRYQASLDAYEALLNREPNNANALAGKNNALSALNNSKAIAP